MSWKSLELRPAGPSDERFLLSVYESTRAGEMAQVPWSEDQKQTFLRSQFEAQRTDYTARFPDAEHSVIVVDGEPIGRVWVDRRADEIRLLDIAILPRRQNTGVGTTLLERLQRQAAEAGMPLRHSVYTTNHDGLRFYRRLGFLVVEDFETHVLMEWNPGVTQAGG